MWTILGIISGAVCMLVGILIGAAIKEYSKEHDGFLVLAKMLEKMTKQNRTGLECTIKCLICSFTAEGANFDDVEAEMKYHASQQHPGRMADVASSAG